MVETPKQSLSFTCVFFDVDGTLVDSGGAVIDTFVEVLTEYRLPVPSREHLRRHVGPPLWSSLLELGTPKDMLETVIANYRSRYHERFLDPPLFEGIDQVVKDLSAAGVAMATATSKQEPLALAQLEHLGLLDHFTVVAGATPDPACTKATVLRDALARLGAAGADTSRPVLVGDRHFDIEGGRAVGVPVIGVGWGYASEGELDGADAFAADPAALSRLLLPH
ncbi:HAD hydrolase-like protein [Schaalia sp. 19OD2882]|nr:HAD hydrolase-like protein [Schaalia sp. 19OD2882]